MNFFQNVLKNNIFSELGEGNLTPKSNANFALSGPIFKIQNFKYLGQLKKLPIIRLSEFEFGCAHRSCGRVSDLSLSFLSSFVFKEI